MENILTLLTGTWFICLTNFPLWTKGDKLQPSFHYSIADTSGKTPVLNDEVRYLKNGKEKKIKGYDYQDSKDPLSFVWRGKGILGLLKSRWTIVLKDEKKAEWIVLYFSKTLFTPEGVDVISRSSPLSPEVLEEIKEKMRAHPLLRNQVSSIRTL